MAATGDGSGARSFIRSLEWERGRHLFVNTALAWTYLGLRDTTSALTMLERAMRAREPVEFIGIFSLPPYDQLRHSARLGAIIRGYGFDPATFGVPERTREGLAGAGALEGTVPWVEVVAWSEGAMITNMSLSPRSTVLVALGVIVILVLLSRCINILRQYERCVVFRLGRAMQPERGPGLVFIFWPIDKLVRVSLRVVTWE